MSHNMAAGEVQEVTGICGALTDDDDEWWCDSTTPYQPVERVGDPNGDGPCASDEVEQLGRSGLECPSTLVEGTNRPQKQWSMDQWFRGTGVALDLL